MPAISVIIPSYRGQKLLAKNLPALLNILRSGDQVIVVDDASGPGDNTLNYFKEKFAVKKEAFSRFAADFYSTKYNFKNKKIELILLINRANVRYAKSVNRAVKIAKHDFLLMLNNDVTPNPGSIEKLLYHFAEEDVFAVACLENNSESHSQSGKNILYFKRGLFMHNKAADLKFGQTAWATGGSSMFRKTMWLELAGFDQRFYPAYWEDIDLSFQARKRGWLILFEPQATVEHNHETTNNSVFGQDKIRQMSWSNAIKFTVKNADFLQLVQFYLWRPYWWYQAQKFK